MNAFPPAPPAGGQPPIGTPQPVRADDLVVKEIPVGALAQDPGPTQELPPVTHSEPILTGGAAGPPVERLARLLAALGYANNSVVKGENPHAILDISVMADVQRFWADYSVSEPPELFQGRDVDPTLEQGKWVGPHTWQALKDAVAALAEAPVT